MKGGSRMKRKKILLIVSALLIIAAVITADFVLRMNNKGYLIETFKAEDYDKIEMWQNNTCSLITEKDKIEDFINMIQTKKLKRRYVVEEKIGYVFYVKLCKNDKIVNEMVIGGSANITVLEYTTDGEKAEYYDFDVPSADDEYKDFFKFYNNFLDNVD